MTVRAITCCSLQTLNGILLRSLSEGKKVKYSFSGKFEVCQILQLRVHSKVE